MKRITSLLLTLIIICAALCSCSSNIPGEDLTKDVSADENKTYYFKKGETIAPTSYTDYKSAAISFSSKILSALLEDNKNAVYSPAALYRQLILLQNAASGDTQNSIKLITGETVTLEDLNSSCGYFFGRLEALSGYKKDSRKSYVDLNSDLFVNDDLSVSQDFLLKNADFNRSGVFRLSFSDNDFTKKVNAYISDNSKATYTASVNKDSGMLLLNSAYMNDVWLDKFERTAQDTFKGKKAEFLNGTEFYISDKNCEGFIKDLKNTPSKFVAVIPKKGGVDELLKKLDGYSFTELINSMSVFKTCSAYIPEFSKKGELNFTDEKAFSFLKGTGNYSALSYNTKTRVSDIIQDFEIKIDENGISSDKTAKTTSVKKKPDKTLKFNRPFIYAVIDNESNIPVFMGVISDI